MKAYQNAHPYQYLTIQKKYTSPGKIVLLATTKFFLLITYEIRTVVIVSSRYRTGASTIKPIATDNKKLLGIERDSKR